jgi:hypothetical protein
MDSKLLLVKSITLLYKEGLLNDPTENSASLVREVIAGIRLPEVIMETDPGRQSVIALKTTALWMCENPPGHCYERSVLLQRIRVNTGEEEGLYMAFLSGMEDSDSPETLKRACVEHRAGLRSYLDQLKIKEILKRASSQVMFQEETIDWATFVEEVIGSLEPYMGGITEISKDGVVDEVDFSDLNRLAELMMAAQDDISSDGILRTGWQGLNDMTGEHQGFRRGECIVVPALQFNFKTGFTLNIFRQLAMYNKPYLLDPTKKPLLIHVSTENSLRDNIMLLYIQLKENELGVACDVTNITVEEAAGYVKAKMQAMGYNIYMVRWNPTDVTFHKIFDLVTYFESQGYEVHGMVFDYLNMISKKGCAVGGPTGSDIRDLFRRVRNFMSARKILFITPHQLSTEAKMLKRQGVENFVQTVANLGYYDGCRTIDQEVDLEIYIDIVKVNGKSYLTIQRGKHRKPRVTREEDLYCVYAFEEVAAIPDDVNGISMKRKHAGGGFAGSAEEKPWFATAA